MPKLDRSLLVAFGLWVVAAPTWADDADAAALSLADRTAENLAARSDWRVFSEATGIASTRRDSGATRRGTRLSIDARYDGNLAPGWRAVVADRLDMNRLGEITGNSNLNTLKEAYLSWQRAADQIVDLGRINARQGVATGYNPTDYFRAGALRSVVSINPASLRENRLGSVMLRGQSLWAGGSLTAVYSPKLAGQPSASDYSLDLGASNPRDRWQVAVSQQLTEKISPQWLLSGGAGQSPQVGVNLTGLLNDATVAYAEWSGGRAASLLTQALNLPQDRAFRSRLASGLTYTTASDVSLTLEYQYNDAGLDREAWNRLRFTSPPAAYAAYRGYAANLQDPPTRQALFLDALWQDALIPRLDLTAIARCDATDRSRLQWLEARYHWTRVDLALQVQVNSGNPGSDYGAIAERRIRQVLLRYFF